MGKITICIFACAVIYVATNFYLSERPHTNEFGVDTKGELKKFKFRGRKR